ncbi:N(6)-adenine-specific methyltransferase METTL4 isoform X2 [Neocloeon triangulifer]|uniref:N(6)-adenine-specific methyltransferase METTL4 isoform X2 n=1 Tax=Neocloeon triangulifer TaxID=2078957 RepID=UPI00286EF804|nr:N(6)-adenine-specific methyltransferase METTL4 isoform X2 [Neocloeon triangulifer]
MSVILRDSSSGAFISHEVFLKRTYSTAGLAPADQMFGLRTPFMTEAQAAKTAARMMGESTAGPARKRIRSQKTESPNNTEEKLNEVGDVQEKMSYVIKLAKASGFFNLELTPKDFVSNNSPARQFSDMVFKQSNLFGDSASFQDKNTKNKPVLRCIRGENYVLPGNCRFFCGDLFNSMNFLSSETFDLVIVDPPWWNKYIRRIKSAARHSTYPMMYNKDLSKIPVGNYLTAEGLVAIWCTNSPNNIKELIEMVLPEWGFQSVATWFWAKVTKAGETVCAFSQPPGKQPYERIIFARKICKTDLPNPVDKQVLISVPSAVHSHKPPLTEVLAPYLPQNFKTLELFARNLLPNTTSCGLEVLKLQHEILFQKQNIKKIQKEERIVKKLIL